jgi:hypothetical protein
LNFSTSTATRLAGIQRDVAYAISAGGGFQSAGSRVPRPVAGLDDRFDRLDSAASTARTIAPCSTPSASID